MSDTDLRPAHNKHVTWPWLVGSGCVLVAGGVFSVFAALFTEDYDPCGNNDVYVSTPFPKRAWCVTPDETVSLIPDSVGYWQTGILTYALILLFFGLCALLPKWVWRARALSVVLACAIVLPFGLSNPQPPPEAREEAIANAERQAQREHLPPPPPPPTSADARRALDGLAASAVATDPTLLWLQEPTITENSCTTDDGEPGTSSLLDALFTTRDLETAKDNLDFLEITQANEAAAKTIVGAWVHGPIAYENTEVIHAEYWPHASLWPGLHQVRVGFDQGNGQISVVTDCFTS